MLNVLVVQNCAVLETLVKALALYLTFSRSGPNTAPRAHMGSPVWAASNHFTATSPESSGKGQRKAIPILLKMNEGVKMRSQGSRVSKRTCVMTPWLQNIAFIPLCCRSQLQFVARQNQSALMLSAQQFVRKGALISMKCVKTAGKEISYWEYHCSVRCSLQLALPPMHTLILANIINNSLYYYKSLDY